MKKSFDLIYKEMRTKQRVRLKVARRDVRGHTNKSYAFDAVFITVQIYQVYRSVR